MLLLVAAGLASLPVRIRAVAVAVVIVLSLSGLGGLYASPKTDWRQLASEVSASIQPGDSIAYFHPASQTVFDYYANRTPASLFPRLAPGENFFRRYPTISLPLKDIDARSIVAGRERVWVIYSHESSHQHQLRIFHEALAREGLHPGFGRRYGEARVRLFTSASLVPEVKPSVGHPRATSWLTPAGTE
jgi:hypothetical protein